MRAGLSIASAVMKAAIQFRSGPAAAAPRAQQGPAGTRDKGAGRGAADRPVFLETPWTSIAPVIGRFGGVYRGATLRDGKNHEASLVASPRDRAKRAEECDQRVSLMPLSSPGPASTARAWRGCSSWRGG